MAFQKFIKENLALTIGISLPILLIILFSLFVIVPKSLSTPPQYEMIFSVTEYQRNENPDLQTSFNVKDGKIHITTSKRENKYHNNKSKIYIFNGQKESIRERAFTIPKTEGTALLKETKDLNISPESKAPDDYAFYTNDHSYGLVQEIFIGGHSRNRAQVKKGMAVYKIPNINKNNYYYRNIVFLGWIIPTDEAARQ